MFFYDPDIMPLHIHENYLKNKPDIPSRETGRLIDYHVMNR